MSKKRTYLEAFVDFGFDFIAKDNVQQPQCIFCFKGLGDGYIKPSILKAHFTSSHCTHVHDYHTYLLAKRTLFRAGGTLPSLGFIYEDKSALGTSRCIVWKAAKEKFHAIRERLVKQCAMNMVKLVCGREQKTTIEKISLSNDRVRRRTNDMSQEILHQMAKEFRISKARISL